MLACGARVHRHACRKLHAVFAAENAHHCAHLSFKPMADPEGKVKCQESAQIPVSDLFSDDELAIHPERFLTFVCPVTSISFNARRKRLSSHREGRPRIKAVPPDLLLLLSSSCSLLFSSKDDEGFAFASSAATISSTLVLFFVFSSSSSPLGRLHERVSSSAVAAEGGASSSFGEIIVDLVVLLAPEKGECTEKVSLF